MLMNCNINKIKIWYVPLHDNKQKRILQNNVYFTNHELNNGNVI